MRITLSIIKADIGSIGGHIKPSRQLLERAREFVDKNGKGLIDDFYVSHTGEDIALLFFHQKGTGNEDVHKMAWDAFLEGTEVAKEQGLYVGLARICRDTAHRFAHLRACLPF